MIKKLLFIALLFLSSFTSSLMAAKEVENNTIVACENSLEMLEWDLEFIRHARQSVELSACYTGGTVLKKILTVVAERLESVPSLKVHILACPTFFDAKDKLMIQSLQRQYPNNFNLQLTASVMSYIPDYSAIDNHVKCLIVDEKYFSVGGTNFDEVLCTDGRYTPPRNPERESAGLNLPGGPAGVRDQDVVGAGPLAKELREHFFLLYAVWEEYLKTFQNFHKNPHDLKEKSRYFSLDASILKPFVERFEFSDSLVEVKQAKMILSGAMDKPNRITSEYLKLIQNAKKEIFIGNLYFSPVDSVMNALKGAINRDVQVNVITNGVGGNAPEYTQFFAWANRIHYVPLMYGRDFHFWEIGTAAKASVKNAHIYEYNIKDIVYHKKVMVVDERYTIIGSYNLGIRSDQSDFELVLVIDSEPLAKKVKAVLKTDVTLSFPVSAKSARDWYFDPLISYLASTQKKFHGLL